MVTSGHQLNLDGLQLNVGDTTGVAWPVKNLNLSFKSAHSLIELKRSTSTPIVKKESERFLGADNIT